MLRDTSVMEVVSFKDVPPVQAPQHSDKIGSLDLSYYIKFMDPSTGPVAAEAQ